jgi:hypothetical protein
MSEMDKTRVNESGRRRFPAAAWVAVGLLAAALIAPASAVAASSLVGIVGGNGARAEVTAADQLQTAETSPANFVALYASSDVNKACDLFYKVPKGKGLIIQTVTFNAITVTSPGFDTYAALYPSSSCSTNYFLDSNPSGTGEVSVPLTPGMALTSGTPIALLEEDVYIEVYITGYLVPASDVPSNRLASAQPGAAGRPAQR